MQPYYYSLNEYLKETFGSKLYKIALNGGMTCPNRDGLIDTRGCIFCSAGGSGDFTGSALLASNSMLNDKPTYNKCVLDIDAQINAGKALISSKYNGNKFIAYFQSYTNTYASVDYLRSLFTPVINRPDICAISIGTRPDCLNDDIIQLLSELNEIKPVWIELGLQTIYETTANYIRRGYSLSTYDAAVRQLINIGIHPIVHMIIGLPGETHFMIKETAQYIAHSGASGIKLQLLHILKGTDLATDYSNGLFEAMSLDEYCECLGEVLPVLPKDMVIHRLTGDGPKKLLIAPLWSTDKKRVMNTINHYLKENNIIQGSQSSIDTR